MALNKQNLIPLTTRTKEEHREVARRGGIASGESRNEKKRIRSAVEKALKSKYSIDDRILSGYEAIAVKMVVEALNGNVQAFKELRDTVGEKPSTSVDIGAVDNQVNEVKITFVDKSQLNTKPEKDPQIVGEYTQSINTKLGS